jgi:hypothetical protein
MSINIVNYSEKSIAVLGETKPLREHLSAIGGKWNPSLTHNGEKVAGWIFVTSKRDEVKKVLTSYSQGTLGDAPVKKEYPTKREISPSIDFQFTKEMYLALVTRIEKLENELVIAKRAVGVSSSETPKPAIKKQPVLKFTEDDAEDIEEVEEKKPMKSLFKSRG